MSQNEENSTIPPTGTGLALAIEEVRKDLERSSTNSSMSGEAEKAVGDSKRQLFRSIQSYYKEDSAKFHGRDEEDVAEFLETYESLCLLNDAPESLMARMFQFVLKGTAKDFFRMMEESVKKDWGETKKEFNRRFASAARRQRLTHRYQNLRQKTGRGLDAFYKELVSLSRQLPEEYRAPAMLRDKFVGGLHPSIRKSVTLVDPPTLEAAYDRAKLALQTENLSGDPPKDSRRSMHGAPWRTKRNQDTLGAISDGKQRQKSVTCYNCGMEGHPRSQCTNPPKCYNCGGSGHISRRCPKKKQDGNKNEEPKNE